MEMLITTGKAEFEPYQIAYWRKHSALHSWMEDLWIEKGGGGEFNCVDIYLTFDDIDRLEAQVLQENLKAKSGFFWGATVYSPDQMESFKEMDLQFILDARRELGIGNIIYYTSWW